MPSVRCTTAPPVKNGLPDGAFNLLSRLTCITNTCFVTRAHAGASPPQTGPFRVHQCICQSMGIKPSCSKFIHTQKGAWDGCIGKKGATYAARFRDLMNDWSVSRFWASTD